MEDLKTACTLFFLISLALNFFLIFVGIPARQVEIDLLEDEIERLKKKLRDYEGTNDRKTRNGNPYL